MDNTTIAVFNNKIFLEIINEIKLFSNFVIKHYEDSELCIKDAEKKGYIVVYFDNSIEKIKTKNFPSIAISKFSNLTKKSKFATQEQIKMPFAIFEFKKKIVSLIAKDKFKKNSLIKLGNYVIDKNERKIKKNNLELQLSEKEVNFLTLFSENSELINRKLVLKSVWKYSKENETHTVETHIHSLRKKILKKFNDGNFIKNNNKGYYI